MVVQAAIKWYKHSVPIRHCNGNMATRFVLISLTSLHSMYSILSCESFKWWNQTLKHSNNANAATVIIRQQNVTGTILLLLLLKVPERIEFKQAILVTAPSYLADEYHQSSDVAARRHRLCFIIVACFPTHRSSDRRRPSFSVSAVKHSTTERHVGAVTDCF